MKEAFNIVLFLIGCNIFCQSGLTLPDMGRTSMDEMKMTLYDKDSTANAVVLFEKGITYHDKNRDFNLTTQYYFRIKILNKRAFNKTTIKIPFYKKEKVFNVIGVTYNLNDQGSIKKSSLNRKDVFTKEISASWSEISFTMPNIQEGSVIEYKYSLNTPYFFNLDAWYFQSDIPKIVSKYDSSLLLNWKFNIRLNGYLELNKDNPTIKKNCVYIPNLGGGSCMSLSYEMNDIPAFKEEDYMTSKENYISKLNFDLVSKTEYEKVKSYAGTSDDVREKVTNYIKTWEDADKTIRDDFLDNQTSMKRYFKSVFPKNVFAIENNLEKADKIYNYLQNHFNWNNKYWKSEKIKLKKDFESKVGSVDVINLSLYNSLQAANIESYVAILSTRENGFPSKLTPITKDFNYVIVKVVIEGNVYFLDATDKYLSFGELPLTCLNGDARILDFKKGSYWEKIKTSKKSSTTTRVKLVLDKESNFIGTISKFKKGYAASNQRKAIKNKSREQYLEDIESESVYLEIEDNKIIDLDKNNKPLQEKFDVTFLSEVDDFNILRINPFFDLRIEENPFKLKERNYPVDFGYQRKYTYLLNLKIPKEFRVKKLPSAKGISLPNNGGSFQFKVIEKNNTINIFYKYQINRKLYSVEEYNYLKSFFNEIINSQKTFIEIEKIS